MPSKNPLRVTRVALATFTLLLLVVTSCGFALRAFRQAEESSLESSEVRMALSGLWTAYLAAQTGQLGFLLTGDEAYLEPYFHAAYELSTQRERLAGLVSGDPVQWAHIEALRDAHDNLLRLLANNIASQRRGARSDIANSLRRHEVKTAMERLRQIIATIGELVDYNHARRQADSTRQLNMLMWVIVGATPLVLILGGLLYTIDRDLRRRVDLETRLTRQVRLSATTAATAKVANRNRQDGNESIRFVQMATEACASIQEGFGASHVALWITRSEDDPEMVLVGEAHTREMSQGLGDLDPTLLILRKSAFETTAVSTDPALSHLSKRRISSLAWQTIESDGSILGLLILANATSSNEAQDREAIGAIAGLLANAILRSRSQAILKEREGLYSFLANAIPGQVWAADETGQLTFVNDKVGQYAGRPNKEMLNDGWTSLLHPDDVQSCINSWQHAVGTGTEYECEFRLRNASGAYRMHIARAHPYRNGQGEVSLWVGTNIDIHEERLSHLALIQTNEALVQTNRELDQFAYVASHDLKAPLRGIANLSQWLEEDMGPQLSGESLRHMTLLRGRVMRLEGLIDGVLQYARSGRGEQKIALVDVVQLVETTVDMLQPPEGTTIEISPDLPKLTTAHVPLQQVFLNLIGNAFKHVHGPDARVSIYGQNEGGVWKFFVQDNGPGIAPQFQKKIWELFQRLEARDQAEGTGVGLSVVRKIVQSRGGQVAIESEENQGAKFSFTWPLEGSN